MGSNEPIKISVVTSEKSKNSQNSNKLQIISVKTQIIPIGGMIKIDPCIGFMYPDILI